MRYIYTVNGPDIYLSRAFLFLLLLLFSVHYSNRIKWIETYTRSRGEKVFFFFFFFCTFHGHSTALNIGSFSFSKSVTTVQLWGVNSHSAILLLIIFSFLTNKINAWVGPAVTSVHSYGVFFLLLCYSSRMFRCCT